MTYRARSTDVWFNLPGVVAAWQPVACPAGSAAARQNVAHDARTPGRSAAVVAIAPGFNPRVGWQFTGTQYLDTLTGPPQDTQAGSLLIRYSDWTRANSSKLFGTFFSGSGAREFFVGKNGATYSIANHGVYNPVTLPTGGVVGFAGTAAYIDGVNVGTLTSPGVYNTRRLIIGAAIYYNDGLTYSYATANIQAALLVRRTLTPAEVWSASRQMAWCHVNPDWSAWGRRRRYYVVPPPTAEDRRAEAAAGGYFGATLAAAAQGGSYAGRRAGAAVGSSSAPRLASAPGGGHDGDRRPAAPAGGHDG